MTIKQIFKNKEKQKKIKFFGWIITNRGNKKVRFLTINDGSCFKNIQVVVKDQKIEKISSYKIGSSIFIEGLVQLTPNSQQELEIIPNKIKLLKNIDEDYPLQKQKMSKEYLRQIPHMRHKTNLFRSIMRVRSTLFQEIHNFFAKEGFLNISSPIITSNDGEGAGEAFLVEDESKSNFFNKKATLGVTGQLHAESYANGFGKVYAFGPTFRAENSNTKKHAAEFWMLEPEMEFYGMEDAVKFIDKFLKEIIKNIIKKHPDEFEFFNQKIDKKLNLKINKFLKKGIQKINYSDAIIELQKHKNKFKEKNIKFGMDLSTEHEKFIASEIFDGPVAVVNYPKEIKAFYMKQNDDKKTVAAFDVLVPGVGELVGGSERECDYNKLLNRIKELNIPQKDIQWYLNLRRWGHTKSTGLGLGFERLLMYITGIDNIRDSIPFPRTPQNLKM